MRTLSLHRIDLRPDVAPADGIREMDPSSPLLTATDLAATRGDGIFETVVVVHGVPQALGAHLDRFARSAQLLDLPEPRRELWHQAVRVASAAVAAHTPRGAVKFVMTRGDEAVDGPPTGWALGFEPPQRAGGDTPQVDVVLLDRGYRHDVAQTSPWLLQGAKSLSYAVNMAALREARRRGAQDVIFTSIDGDVLEGPNSTVIALIDGCYVTVPTTLGVLEGTTQGDAFTVLEGWGAAVATRRLSVPDLHRADAIWLCSSTRGVAAVRSLDGHQRAVDLDLTRRLNHALDAREEE